MEQLKNYKPTTPSLRHKISYKSVPHEGFKPLIKGKKATGFRNNKGHITIRHRGGGHKRNIRIID
jgi:large subunit ribosomal protein L2